MPKRPRDDAVAPHGTITPGEGDATLLSKANDNGNAALQLLSLDLKDRDWGGDAPPLDVLFETDASTGQFLKLVAFARDNGAHNLTLIDRLSTCTLELDVAVDLRQYRANQDSCGLWVRHDDDQGFFKAGVEARDGHLVLAIDAAPGNSGAQPLFRWAKLDRHAGGVVSLAVDWRDGHVHVRHRTSPSEPWAEVTSFAWSASALASAGIFCAAPNRKGFFAEFVSMVKR